jgi:transcriptional regulator with PAS, ATPase and Fis domain
LTMQAKLLRAMQSKEIMRVGGKSLIKVNVRIIAATNRPLEDLVQQGQFREDLYYRLSVARIDIPPLRERLEALEPLSDLFLAHFNAKHRRKTYFSASALEVLKNYDWPGNVRQLENVIESLVIACSNDEINPCDLPVTLSRKNYEMLADATFTDLAANRRQSLKGMMDDVEKLLLNHFLQLHRNDIYRLSSELQCDRSTLQRKLRKHKIRVNRRRKNGEASGQTVGGS